MGRSSKYTNWYKTAAWQRRRSHQLLTEPLCVMCMRDGKVVAATVADHVEPHAGDYNKFVLGQLQSLCEHCHNRRKQRVEQVGFEPTVDQAGWPTDPNHPTNLMLKHAKSARK